MVYFRALFLWLFLWNWFSMPSSRLICLQGAMRSLWQYSFIIFQLDTPALLLLRLELFYEELYSVQNLQDLFTELIESFVRSAHNLHITIDPWVSFKVWKKGYQRFSDAHFHLEFCFNLCSPSFEISSLLLRRRYSHSFLGQFVQVFFQDIEDISFEIHRSLLNGSYRPMF